MSQQFIASCTTGWKPEQIWAGQFNRLPYKQSETVVTYNSFDLLEAIKIIGAQSYLSVVEISGHASHKDGITVGQVEADMLSPQRQTPNGGTSWDLYYINETNAKWFGQQLNASFKPGSKPTLIILDSCCLGCYTKSDSGGKPVSTAQIIANETGVPVLSPGGYAAGSFLHGGTADSQPTYHGLTRYQNWDELIAAAKKAGENSQHVKDLIAMKDSGYDSKAGYWYLTLPDGMSKFGPIPLSPQ